MEYITLDRTTFKNYMKEFSELYTLCFNVPMSEEEVSWRYLDNPYGEILSCIAVDKGKLIANYSASPIYLMKNEKKVKVALSLNTMTHPAYIGKGLFVDLASSVYKYMDENGYRMIMGFPNNISNRTFVNKLGWNDICTIPTLQLNLNDVIKKKIVTNKTVQSDDYFLLDYSHCYKHGNDIIVYKNEEYLRWRYCNNPAMKYSNFVIQNSGFVSSRIIMKEFRDRINIVDTYFFNDEEQSILINKAIDFAIEKKKQMITLWSKLGSKAHLLLESYGCVLSTPMTYFGVNVFKKEDDFAEYYQENNWFLNMSDDNVY